MALALLVSACGGGESAPSAIADTAAPQTTSAPSPAFPDFTVLTSDGGQIEWSSLQGQDVVLWFWAPW